MVVTGLGGNELEEFKRQRRQEELASHKGSLSLFGLGCIVSHRMRSDGRKRNYSILLQQVVIGRDSSGMVGNWNGEDSDPTPHLRFLEHEVKENLEIGRISKIKWLFVQRFGRSFEMLGPTDRSEIKEHGGIGQWGSKGEHGAAGGP